MDRATFMENAIAGKKVKFEELIVNKKIKFEPLIIKKRILDAVFNIHAHVVNNNSGGGIEVLYGTPEEPVSLHDKRFTSGESKMYFICGCISDFPEDSETMAALEAENNEEAVYRLYVQPMNVNEPSYMVTLDASDYLNAMSLGEYSSLFYDIYYAEEENDFWLGWISTTYGSFTKSLIGTQDNPIDLTNLDNPYIYKVTGYLKEVPKVFKDSGYVSNNRLRGYLYVFNGENSYYPSVFIMGNEIFTKNGGDSLEKIKRFQPLPTVTNADDGKTLIVENGEWVIKKVG